MPREGGIHSPQQGDISNIDTDPICNISRGPKKTDRRIDIPVVTDETVVLWHICHGLCLEPFSLPGGDLPNFKPKHGRTTDPKAFATWFPEHGIHLVFYKLICGTTVAIFNDCVYYVNAEYNLPADFPLGTGILTFGLLERDTFRVYAYDMITDGPAIERYAKLRNIPSWRDPFVVQWVGFYDSLKEHWNSNVTMQNNIKSFIVLGDSWYNAYRQLIIRLFEYVPMQTEST